MAEASSGRAAKPWRKYNAGDTVTDTTMAGDDDGGAAATLGSWFFQTRQLSVFQPCRCRSGKLARSNNNVPPGGAAAVSSSSPRHHADADAV